MASFKSNKLPKATLSLLASGIGPDIPWNIIETVYRDRISHLNLHANNLECLGCFPLEQDNSDRLQGKTLGLEHLENLDVSSNKLSLSKSPSKYVHSVLGISTNLIHLNLAANQLTSASLAQLFHQGKIRLHALKVLDLSYNLLTRLPVLHPPEKKGTAAEGGDTECILCTSCPNLETLVLINNRISDLPELVKAIHSYQCVLKRLKLQQKESKGPKDREQSSNPVCYHPAYRHYIILTLESLLELDGLPVSEEERKDAQMHQYTDYTGVPSFSSLITTSHIRYNVMPSDCNHMQKTLRKVDAKKRFQRVIRCPEPSPVLVGIHPNADDVTNMLRKQRSSSIKLKDLEKHIDTLTDLTQKHVEVTNHLMSSTHQHNKSDDVTTEYPEVSNVDVHVQTSFLSMQDTIEDESSMRIWGRGKDLYHKDRNYLVFALFFTCHYWYMFVKEEQYRAAQRRLKICRQKMDAIKRSIHNNNKPSSTIPESTFNESAEYIQAMKNDISTLSKKLEVSEEQIRSNTIKYERLKIQEKELRRCVLKAQDSDEDARRQLYACHDHMNQFEQRERDLRNEVEQTMRGLKDEQLRCKALSDQLSEQKVQHMMDTQKLEHIISRSEQEIHQLKSAFESLAKQSAEDRARKNMLEPIVNEAKMRLQDKMIEFDGVKKEYLQQINECDAIKAELSACKLAYSETKQIVDEAYRKEAESREGMMALAMRLEQIEAFLCQRSTELEITRDKYKRKSEKLQESEKRNRILSQEMENIKIQREQQAQSYAELLDNRNDEKNNEQKLKIDIDHLKTKIKEMEQSQLKQDDLLKHHERDAVENCNLVQALASDMDSLQRQNERLLSKKERAERQAKSFAEELERERQINHALREQLKEANKAHESQYGKAKAFIENAYKEIIQPNNPSVLHS